jgi:hypothetical protein
MIVSSRCVRRHTEYRCKCSRWLSHRLIHVHLTYSEELPQLVETRNAACALSDHEVVRGLVAGLVAASSCPVRLPDKPDREASFPVYETDHPATLLDQSFLLVCRITRHVVTIVNAQSDITMSSAGYPDFPAFGQMRTVPLPARGAANLPPRTDCAVLFGHVTLGRL